MLGHLAMQSIPAEKVIPGTNFTVDGFRHCSSDVQAYFLSHAHSGASRSFHEVSASFTAHAIHKLACLQTTILVLLKTGIKA